MSGHRSTEELNPGFARKLRRRSGEYGRGAMVRTPWGDSNELRERRLPPGPTSNGEQASRNQRERLFGAMVGVASTKGYAACTVADLLEVSGVSRRSFYAHFTDKHDCFMATLDEVLSATMAITASRLRRDGGWEERAQRSLMTFLELLVTQPAASRLCLVESHAAGPAAVARVDEAINGFKGLMAQALQERPGHEAMPEELIWAIVGGLQKVVHSRLHRGEERELLELGPSLIDLVLTYSPPPVPLRIRRRRRGAREEEGTQAGGPNGGEAALRGTYVGERIAAGTLAAVAKKGLAETTVNDIAEAAGVSLSTFYENFDGKSQAFDTALYAGRARMMGFGVPVFRRAPNWPEGIRALSEFGLDYLASYPPFAQAISRDVYAAGPEALAGLDEAIAALQSFIDAGAERYAPEMPPIWREAITSSLYAMTCRHVSLEGAGALPELAPLATYLALAPFLGPDAACEVANGGCGAEATSGL